MGKLYTNSELKNRLISLFLRIILIHNWYNAVTGEIDVSASTTNTYNVIYTTSGTCPNSNTFDVTITDVTLGINDFYIEEFKMYSNPTSNVLNISIPVNKLIIYNVLGIKVMETNF